MGSKGRMALVAALLLAGMAGTPPAADLSGPDGKPAPLARVGREEIGLSDLEDYLALRQERGGEGETGVRKRLEEMIVQELLRQEALRLGLDREPAVRRALRQVLIQALLEREVERPWRERPLAEEEVRAFYEGHRGEYQWPEGVRVADVFLAAPASGDPALRQERRRKAEEILARALSLPDRRFGFGELVLAHSDTHPAYPRGDTGFFDRSGAPQGLPPPLVEAAFAIPRPGQLHPGVVETPEGFHVVMLTGRREARNRTLDERGVRAEVETRLRRESIQKGRETLVEGLRRRIPVTVDEGVLRSFLEGRSASQPPAQDGVHAPPPLPPLPR